MVGKKSEEFKFYAKHFWQLMEQQEWKCALTGRELTPYNTEVELRDCFKKEGRSDFDNHYLIDRSLSALARYVPEDKIIELAAEIIEYRGKEKGYSLRKVKK